MRIAKVAKASDRLRWTPRGLGHLRPTSLGSQVCPFLCEKGLCSQRQLEILSTLFPFGEYTSVQRRPELKTPFNLVLLSLCVSVCITRTYLLSLPASSAVVVNSGVILPSGDIRGCHQCGEELQASGG